MHVIFTYSSYFMWERIQWNSLNYSVMFSAGCGCSFPRPSVNCSSQWIGSRVWRMEGTPHFRKLGLMNVTPNLQKWNTVLTEEWEFVLLISIWMWTRQRTDLTIFTEVPLTCPWSQVCYKFTFTIHLPNKFIVIVLFERGHPQRHFNLILDQTITTSNVNKTKETL